MQIRSALRVALVLAGLAGAPAAWAQDSEGFLVMETYRGVDVLSGVREFGGPWTDSNTKSAAPGLKKPSARKLVGVGGNAPYGYMEFAPNTQSGGKVTVEITWPADSNAKGVAITIDGAASGGGTKAIDFDPAKAGQWIPIGDVDVTPGRPIVVRVDARPTTGPVDASKPHQLVIDAVRFRKEGGGAIDTVESSNPFAQPNPSAPEPPKDLGTNPPAAQIAASNPFVDPAPASNIPPPNLPPPGGVPAVSNPFADPAPASNIPLPNLPPPGGTAPATDPFAAAQHGSIPNADDPFAAALGAAAEDRFAAVPDAAAMAEAQQRAQQLPPPVATTQIPVAPINPFDAPAAAPPAGLQPVGGNTPAPPAASLAAGAAPADPFAGALAPSGGREALAPPTTSEPPAAVIEVTRGTSPFAGPAVQVVDSDPVPFMDDVDAALAKANREESVVVVIFTADNQASRQFQNKVLADRAVKDVLRKTVPVLLNFHDNPAMAERFSVRRAPYTVVLDRRGFTKTHIGEASRPAAFARELRGAAL
jgi:hypothetical protein